MFIRSPHRSKLFIVLSTLFVALIIALAAMRADITEAQQNAGHFLPSSSPPRAVVVERQNYGLPPVGFPIPPNNQNNPAGSPWYTPPNQSHPNNGFGPQNAMPTAAPMTESDRRALEIANRIRQTRDNDEREQLRNQLRETLNAAFDQRREQQLQEMEQLERQLDSIRKLDEKRQQRKEEIVQRRISDLLSEPDALDWEPKRLEGQYGFPGPMPGSLPPGGLPPGGLQPPRVSGLLPLPGAPRFPSVAPNNPSEKADSTTLPQHASDAFTYQLTESIMENIERLRSQREQVKGLSGLSDKQSVHVSAVDARFLASIENGRSIWRTIGKQKERDVDSAAAALEHAKQRLKIKVAAFEKGNLAQINLMDDEAAVERLNAEVARAKDQLVVWKELDQRLQDALNEVGLSEPEQKAADEAIEKDGEEAVEKQEDNGPGDASVEQGATRHRLFHDLRFCYRVAICQTMATKT